jgi:type 1 glutamine amidotransferase
MLLVVSLWVGMASSNGSEQLDPVRIMIVTGVDYEGHFWKETAPELRRCLDSDERIEARVFEDPEVLATPLMQDYDVILLHFKNYDELQRSAEVRKNLNDWVTNGGGLVLYHFACGAFEQWPDFVRLAGRVWDKEKRPHDPYGPFTVHLKTGHPVTEGLEDFEIRDELYTCLGGDEPIEVVATAVSVVDKQVYPMAFVLEPGRGRVFHTVLGHGLEPLNSEGFLALLKRGCLWAAGRIGSESSE